MYSKDRLDFFRNLQLFASLSLPDIHALASMSYEKNSNKNQFLFQEGDDPECFFFVKHGHIMLTKQAPNGKNLIINVLTSGDFCGEVGVFNNIPYIASAQALEDTSVYFIRRENLLPFIQDHPNMILELIGMSVKKLIEAFSMIYGLGNKSLKQRVAFTLLKLSENIGEIGISFITIRIPITRQHLAEMVGSTPESVSRIMANLKREGIIKSVRRKIAILNEEALRQIAEEIE